MGAWLSALVACEAFGGDSPDEAEETSKDAGTKTKDAGSDGPSSESSSSGDDDDVAAPIDAATLNKLSGDVPYDEFDDFERPNLELSGPFNWKLVKTGVNASFGSSGCDDTSKCSGSKVAVFQNALPDQYVYFETLLQAATRVVRLDFALKTAILVNQGGDAQVQIASFEVSEDRFVVIEIFNGDYRLVDQYRKAPNQNYDSFYSVLGTAVAGGEWTRYRAYLNLDTKRIALTVNGELFATAITVRPEVIDGKKLVKARIGAPYADANHRFQLRYDDVGLAEWTE